METFLLLFLWSISFRFVILLTFRENRKHTQGMKRELSKKQEMEGQKLAASFLAEIPVPQGLIRINDGDSAWLFVPGGVRMKWTDFPFDEMMVGGGEGERRKRNAKVKSSDKTVLAAQLSTRAKLGYSSYQSQQRHLTTIHSSSS